MRVSSLAASPPAGGGRGELEKVRALGAPPRSKRPCPGGAKSPIQRQEPVGRRARRRAIARTRRRCPPRRRLERIESFFFARQRPFQASSVHTDAEAYGDCAHALRQSEIRRGR